jgi:alpha-amylase
VREGLVAWLRYLQKDVGFDAWRFDFARGYSSKYVKTYVDSTTSQLSLNVGEVWVDLDWSGPGGTLAANQDSARKKLAEWIEGCEQRATVFDFVTKGVLTEAVRHTQYWRLRDKQGRAAGLVGWWPQQAVTFVDNHDTGSSQRHWPFPADRLALGYAYIITHPGVPCVFAEHYWGGQAAPADPELRATIDTLLQARWRVGISATSSLVITAAEDDMYVATISGEHGQLTIKLGPRFEMGDLLPQEPYWRQLCCGQDFCVWESTRISSAAGSSNSLAGGFGGSSICSGSSSSLNGQ